MKKRVISLILTAALLLTLLPMVTVAIEETVEDPYVMSEECLEMLKEFEGFSSKPYWDNGQWTVGYGTRAPSEHLARYQKEGISREEATELLRNYLVEYGEELKKFADKFGLTFTQGQADALLSLSYNCGPNWMWSTSTLRTAIIEGWTGNDFLFAMGQWSTAGGSVQRGLVQRRLIEINMYLNERYSMDVPENYSYVLYDPNGGVSEIKVQAFDTELTAKIRPEPTYEGYTFDGWYTKAEGGEKVTLLDANVAGYKLYAHWTSGDGTQTPEEPEDTVITGTPVDYQRKVTSEVLSVLQQPVSGSQVLSACKKGAVVDITAEYTDKSGKLWGQIKNSGWIDLSGTEEFSWEDAESSGIRITVTANNVNIRKGPGTNYGRIGSVDKGEEMVIISTASGSGYTWGQYSGGWICLKYTNYDAIINQAPELPEEKPQEPEEKPEEPEQTPEIPEEPQPETPVSVKGTVKVEDGLRIRTQPGTSGAIVGYLKNGTEVTILEQRTVDGTTWGRIERGWISLDYVVLETDEEEVPEEPEQTPEVPEPTVRYGTITGDYLRIRSGPSTAYAIVGYLNTGDQVVITEAKTTGTTVWGKIDKGWISMDYVRISTQKPEGTTPDPEPEQAPADAVMGTITGDYLRIRSGAGMSHEILGYMNTGDRVQILEKKEADGITWAKTDKGWISMDYVRLDNADTQEKLTATVNEGNLLRIRSGAGSGYSVTGYLNAGETVEILERQEVDGVQWGRTELGWINLFYVTLSDGTQPGPGEETTQIEGTVIADVLNVRKEPGLRGEVVGFLLEGTKVTVYETKTVGDMVWGRIDQGWVSMDYIQ